MSRSRACDVCGATYEARSSRSRFCGDHCRKRARRSVVTALPTNPTPIDITTATRRELEAVGRAESALGVVALVLSAMLDNPRRRCRGPSSPLWSVSIPGAWPAAVKDARPVDDSGDVLVQLRKRRDAKRADRQPS